MKLTNSNEQTLYMFTSLELVVSMLVVMIMGYIVGKFL